MEPIDVIMPTEGIYRENRHVLYTKRGDDGVWVAECKNCGVKAKVFETIEAQCPGKNVSIPEGVSNE